MSSVCGWIELVERHYKSLISLLALALAEAEIAYNLLMLVRQYLVLPEARSGRGLTAGGSLSPLLGALYLTPLDRVMESLAADGRIFYRRFMDEFIILADTHSKLRRIVRRVYCELWINWCVEKEV